MKIIKIIALTSISAVCAAQDFSSYQLERQLQFDPTVVEQLQSPHRLPNASTLRLSVSDIQLRIPDRYNDENKNRVSELMRELRLLCPDCSTGGTIGGGTIIGGGAVPSANPLFPVGSQLFPTSSGQVLIDKNELSELRRKAALYDLVKAGRENE